MRKEPYWMYKVLIADDERLIRITLKNMIDWSALNCEVIATCKDGKEAYRIYEEVHPEIIITDLKMPEMDGIELIKKIRQEDNNCQIVVLSNYSDFELVRDAMKAGAFDYVLKITLEKEELTKVIKQAKENCEETSSTQTLGTKAGLKELQQCLILSKNEHIFDHHEYERALSLPIFKDYESYYQLAYFRVDNIHVVYDGKYYDHDHLRKNLNDFIRESISMYLQYQIVFISNHSGVLLIHSAEKIRVMSICHSIIRNIEQYMNIKISITLSDVQHSMDGFDEVYRKLIQAHEQRFYRGEGVLIQSEEPNVFCSLDMNNVNFHKDFLEMAAKKNFNEVEDIIVKMLSYMSNHYIFPHQVIDYVIFIIHQLEGKEIEQGTRQNLPFDVITTRIRMCETIDKLEEVLHDGFLKIEAWKKDTNNGRYRKEITDVMEFVDKNYSQKLNLKMLAETLDMSESTLSRLFKNETGINLNYYINEKRMQKAKELLQSSELKIKDVASAVGMDDQLYFNKVFKKYFDMTPSDYRKQFGGQQQG